MRRRLINLPTRSFQFHSLGTCARGGKSVEKELDLFTSPSFARERVQRAVKLTKPLFPRKRRERESQIGHTRYFAREKTELQTVTARWKLEHARKEKGKFKFISVPSLASSSSSSSACGCRFLSSLDNLITVVCPSRDREGGERESSWRKRQLGR